MSWLNNVITAISGKKYDICSLRSKVEANEMLTDLELNAYIDDIDKRIKKMERDLKNIYCRYGVTFNGFKAFDTACDSLRSSIKDGKEVAYNNLIKLESAITTEQKRHLALIRIAMTAQGKHVINEINTDPVSKEVFVKVFGERDSTGKITEDGLYQKLWSEIHRLSEYVIMLKNKVYH